MKRNIIIVILMFLSIGSYAQKVSLEGAYAMFFDRFNVHEIPYGIRNYAELTHGLVVNGLCEIEKSSRVSVVHGLGVGLSLGGWKYRYNRTFLDIYVPLYVKYKFAEIGDSFTIKPFVMAGAMASVNIFYMYNGRSGKEGENRFDIKASVSGGVDVTDHIRVSLNYSIGLLNVDGLFKIDTDKYNKDVLSLGVSYLF